MALITGAASAQSGGSMGGGSMGGSAMSTKDGMAMGHGDGMAAPGVFQGVSGRVVLGHMTMAMKDGHSMVQFAPDFKVDQNKNIDVVLSADMMYSASTALMVGKLGKSTGTQEFMIPTGAMIDHYSYALLRDRSTGMIVGMAKLPAMGMTGKEDGMMKKPGGSNR